MGALSAVDGFVHWLELLIASGIIVTKFSLVRARVLFSNVAVVAPHEGGLALMFRMANERTTQIVDARLSVTRIQNELRKHVGAFLEPAERPDPALAKG